MTLPRAACAALIALIPAALCAAPKCTADRLVAVERIMEYEIIGYPTGSSDLQQLTRGEIRTYAPATGDIFEHNTGEILSIAGVTESGYSYRWQPLKTETWTTGNGIYKSTTIEGASSHHYRKHGPDRDFDPSIAIEDISVAAPDTEMVAGHRCRRSQKALDGKHGISVCNLRIFGRNTPIDGVHSGPDGYRQTHRTISLKQVCVDAARFDIPERAWK